MFKSNATDSDPTISEGQSDDGDSFEEKLSDVLELASGKAAKDRTKALDNLRKAFSKKYIPWYLEDRWAIFNIYESMSFVHVIVFF